MDSLPTLLASLRQLVDSRLDSIERILLSTDISRIERREIVQSVEDQIHELLGRRNEAEPTREGVLAVLAMIDPPEAYLISEESPRGHHPPRDAIDSDPRISVEPARRLTPLAVVSCVMGVVCLLSIILWPISVIAGMAAAICGSIALTQIYYSDRVKGVWLSIVGVCSPAIAMLILFIAMDGF